jgi:hypothetical protein
MNFKEWKRWYKSLPKSMRWFVWLVFLRPLIDNFYYLKEVSPVLSPLNIVGVLTPALIYFSIRKVKKPPHSVIDSNFRMWGSLLLAGVIIMGFSGLYMLNYWVVAFKLLLPVYLFIFLRYFVKSYMDVDGILQTFLYSAIFVVIIFGYEIFFHPIIIGFSRNMERFQGGYADVFNYATYVSLCTLINYYFLLKSNSTFLKVTCIRNVLINLIVASAMLIKMSHVASYAVFLAMNILYFLIAFRKNTVSLLLCLTIILPVAYIYGKETINEKFMPLIENDIEAYSGERDEVQLLHGRVGRWESQTNIFNESSLLVQLFGFPINGQLAFPFFTGGTHNDYLRILFTTGYVGLITYIFLLYNLFKRIVKHYLSLLYLGLGTLACLILYSLSVTPTVYASYMYIVMCIFAFFSIPLKSFRIKGNVAP